MSGGSISEAELVRLLDDEDLGREAYVLETVTAWPALRVLDFLSREGPASTGEVARGINMDMEEVKDLLEDLSELDVVVAESGDGGTVWRVAVDSLKVSIESRDGLRIEHRTQSHEVGSSGRTVTGRADEADGSANEDDDARRSGPFTRFGRRLDSLLGFGNG